MNEYGLVFTGRSARGGYGLGVFKALRQLNIPIKTVVAASTGALNAALIAQNDMQRAQDFWTNLSIENIVKVEKQMAAVEEDRKKNEEIATVIKNAINKGSIDLSPIIDFLSTYINEEKIRESNIDFGLVSFTHDEYKPVQFFKKDMPEGEMLKLIVFSLFYPEARIQENICSKHPDDDICNKDVFSLIFKNKIKNLIVVDMSNSKQHKKIEKKDVNVIYIKCSEEICEGVYDEECLYKHIDFGYNDTLKAFGKLFGSKYYIMPDDKFENSNGLYIDDFADIDFKKFYTFLGLEWTGKAAANNRMVIDKIKRTMQQCSDKNLTSDEIFIVMAEITAEIMGIDKSKIYTLEELVKEIIEKYNLTKESEEFKDYISTLGRLLGSRNQLEFERELKKTIVNDKFIIAYKPYMNINDEAVVRFRRLLAVTFPKLLIANMFISLISKEV